MTDLESGTYEISGVVAKRVLRAAHDANNAIAALAVCLDFLKGRTSGEERLAVDDAIAAARRLAVAVSGIRQETSRAELARENQSR